MIGLLLAWLLPAAAGDLVDGVACVVNDRVITFSEIYEEVPEGFVRQQCGRVTPGRATDCTDRVEAQIAESLIMGALMQQKLAEVQMDITEEELDQTIEGIMRDNQIPDREAFRRALAQQGMTWDIYRAQLEAQVRAMRFRQYFLQPQVNVSDDEVRDAYQRLAREAGDEPQVSLTYLLYAPPRTASEVEILELKAGLTEAVAAAREDGGLGALGTVSGVVPQRASTTSRPEELSDGLKSVLELEPDQIGGPYRVGPGYVVARLDQVNDGGVPPMDQVEGELRQQILQRRMEEEAEQWYVHARRNAAIRCTFDQGGRVPTPGGADPSDPAVPSPAGG